MGISKGMRQINVTVPEKLYVRLKLRLIERQESMRDFFIEFLNAYMEDWDKEDGQGKDQSSG